ncbi:MAG: ABC transporter [Gammaproteobacteria bacterium]|nr:MAG: ABC transporter [Gammaproteobacteria bacterium]
MTWLLVMWKEIIDNLRDRQTLFYALLFGPILLPTILGGILVASFQQVIIDFDEVSELHVRGAAHAPNLVDFLYANNFDVEEVDGDDDVLERNIRDGDWPIVLDIPDDYGDALRKAQPAPLTLHVDQSDKSSMRASRRLQTLLDVFDRKLVLLRLQIRGVDTALFDALAVAENDVSVDGISGQLIASLLPFLFIMSMVMGGFYLAIDTTAGERERQSLEPLLSLPVSPQELLFGKFAATATFIGLSVLLTATSLSVLFTLFPIDLFGSQLNLEPKNIFVSLLLAAPLVPFIAALLILIAALTRSTKEAQTYLGVLMVIPMAPYFLLQFLDIKNTAVSASMPMLGQYQLLERVVLGESLPAWQLTLSVAGTLYFTLLAVLVAVRLYRPERLLR